MLAHRLSRLAAGREPKARHQAVPASLQGGGVDGPGALRGERGAARGEGVRDRAARHEL